MLKGKLLMKMKQKTYLRAIILSTLLFTTFLATPVFAITPQYPYSCSRGVNVYYYIDGGSNNALYNPIRNAAYNWEHTGFGLNPIYLYIKSTNSGTAIDFYINDGSFWGSDGNSVLGQTFSRDASGTEINPYLSNWLYSDIRLNITTLSVRTFAEQQGTTAHEMGHAFGLAHYNSNPNGSIMCQSWVPRTVQTVQQEDNDAINAKY